VNKEAGNKIIRPLRALSTELWLLRRRAVTKGKKCVIFPTKKTLGMSRKVSAPGVAAVQEATGAKPDMYSHVQH